MRNMEADMKGRLQTALQKQTVTLSTWTWVFCFICIIQTGYTLFMNKDIAKTIPQWFVNRWNNGCDIAEMIAGLYQWCYGCLTNYMHSYVVIGIMILASSGILIGGFFLFRNVFDRIDEKWHDRWQYYEVTGVKKLKKSGVGCFVYCQYYFCIDCRNVYSAGYQCGELVDLLFCWTKSYIS